MTNADCELMQEFGAASIQFVVQLAECGMRAEKWPAENPLDALPPSVVAQIDESPTLRDLFRSDQTEKRRIQSRTQLEFVIEALHKVAEAASRFNAAHPELSARAAARWAEIEQNVGKRDAECTLADLSDEATFGVSKDTPLIFTVDSGFGFAMIREKGELRIAKILPASI